MHRRPPKVITVEDTIGRDMWREQAEKLRKEGAKWEGRARELLGAIKELERSNERLREDNVRLSEKLVEVALKPTPIAAPIDITSILHEFRKAVSPDILINNSPDAADQQRAGIVWADQGLDNTGGTPENLTPQHESDQLRGIPDYVLDVEKLTADSVKGSRGGWYNPKPT